MTVIVTRMPGGIAQMFTPESGRVAYKAKSGEAFMLLEAFGGIVRFHARGSKAVVAGQSTELQNCTVIRAGDAGYDGAMKRILECEREFAAEQKAAIDRRLAGLEGRASS